MDYISIILLWNNKKYIDNNYTEKKETLIIHGDTMVSPLLIVIGMPLL